MNELDRTSAPRSRDPRCDRASLNTLAALALAASVGVASSCATTGGPAGPPSQPIARQTLRPEYRLFYDALQDYGDWTLIEPHGYVFRPSIDPTFWRPYQDGFWAPSDVYGWVWVSSEPYGWATYHYGSWFYDDFQGWVWKPGLDWGPAWVAWEMSDQYVGWSPLGSPYNSRVPGGSFVYAPIQQFGSTQVQGVTLKAADLGAASEQLSPVDNTAVHDGVELKLGPPIERVERLTGRPLQRTRIDDPGPAIGRGTRVDRPTATVSPVGPRSPLVEITRRAGEDAARDAKALTARPGAAPARLRIVRAPLADSTAAGRRDRPAVRPRPAQADSAGS